MAYELFLIRVDPSPAPKGLLKELRQAALAIAPAQGPLYEIGKIGGGRFTIDLRSCQATVRPDGGEFRLEDPDPQTVRLIYALAKTGNLIITNSRGPSDAIVVNRTQLKHLPAGMADPKPALCKSAKDLGPLLGIPPKPKRPTRSKPESPGLHDWSKKHMDRRFGRGDPEPHLPGLHEDWERHHLYVQLKPDEGALLAMKRFGQFLKQRKGKARRALPDGGGVGSSDWLLRTPGGETLVPWSVTGYHWRANTDHLIPANIEAWMAILREFARHTDRATGTIVGGKKFVLGDGRSCSLTACESRRARDEEG
jgi:hypothetical protein